MVIKAWLDFFSWASTEVNRNFWYWFIHIYLDTIYQWFPKQQIVITFPLKTFRIVILYILLYELFSTVIVFPIWLKRYYEFEIRIKIFCSVILSVFHMSISDEWLIIWRNLRSIALLRMAHLLKHISLE